MFKFTDYVMLAAPVGVFGAMAALVAAQGLTVGASFLRLTVATYLGFALIFFGLYPALLVFFRIPVREFWRAVREPLSIAFATTSSAAALPRAMENLERFGVARRVVAFVLPTGTLNLAGSGVFLGIAGLFVLQAFQIPLTPMQQLSLFGTLYVASKGIANIPRGSLVALAAGLGGFGVPPEVVGAAFGFLLAIDPILDMPRTVVNSTGIYVAASLVSRWQGNFRQTLPPA